MSVKYIRRDDRISVDREIPPDLAPGLSSTSEAQVKTSWFSRIRQSWLAISIGLIAIAGVLGTIGVTVVALVVLRQTTTTITTILTTNSIISTSSGSTTTPFICFSIPSPRPSNVWFVVNAMSTPRQYHTSTYISQDNSVLIAGGLSGTVLITTEQYFPSTGCFQSGLTMPRARRSHTADILPAFPDYVLLSGGYGTTTIWNVSDLFNPITGNTLTLALTASRYAHGSAVFGSSQIVLAGGIDITGSNTGTGDAIITGSTATFFSTSNMSVPRTDHTVTRLGNNSGVVLIAGGHGASAYYGSTELYYGASNVFFPLGSGGTMSPARAFHTATYLPSPFNKVLITGGCYDGFNFLSTMTLFDAGTLSFTALPNIMSTKRSWHTATLLPNGKILIVGGHNNTIATTSCDLVDPNNNYLLTPAGNLNTGRFRHTATLIPDNSTGTVLICGGTDGTNVLNTCEIYIV